MGISQKLEDPPIKVNKATKERIRRERGTHTRSHGGAHDPPVTTRARRRYSRRRAGRQGDPHSGLRVAQLRQLSWCRDL